MHKDKSAHTKTGSNALKLLGLSKVVGGKAMYVVPPLLVGTPIALGFLLGKAKKQLEADSVPTPEALKREDILHKYDDTILKLQEEVDKDLTDGDKNSPMALA